MLPRSAREVGTGLLYGFQVVLLGHLFFAYGYDAGFAYGVSMTPTIASSGELLITSKKYRRGRGVQVGDIVSFKHPVMNESMQRAAKRVVGMPGDFVLRDKPGAGSYGEEAMLQVCVEQYSLIGLGSAGADADTGTRRTLLCRRGQFAVFTRLAHIWRNTTRFDQGEGCSWCEMAVLFYFPHFPEISKRVTGSRVIRPAPMFNDTHLDAMSSYSSHRNPVLILAPITCLHLQISPLH